MNQLFVYSEIWTVEKREYLKKFKANAHTADLFDNEITK